MALLPVSGANDFEEVIRGRLVHTSVEWSGTDLPPMPCLGGYAPQSNCMAWEIDAWWDPVKTLIDGLAGYFLLAADTNSEVPSRAKPSSSRAHAERRLADLMSDGDVLRVGDAQDTYFARSDVQNDQWGLDADRPLASWRVNDAPRIMRVHGRKGQW